MDYTGLDSMLYLRVAGKYWTVNTLYLRYLEKDDLLIIINNVTFWYVEYTTGALGITIICIITYSWITGDR